MKIGIACSAGSFKGVFVHGVLDGFGEAGFKADIYAASSSSSLAAAYAALGDIEALNGSKQWIRLHAEYAKNGYDISAAIIEDLDRHLEYLRNGLSGAGRKRLGIAVSAVVRKETEKITQGSGSRRLGKKLLLATRNHDTSWAENNLEPRLFVSDPTDTQYRLHSGNLYEALYATTRMLHAWRTPAWIDGQAYIDASYTSSCPALELAEMGCGEIVAISTEQGPLYRDLFRSSEIPATFPSARIHIIRPEVDLAEIGVNFLKATDAGFRAVYKMGRKSGKEFLESGNLH